MASDQARMLEAARSERLWPQPPVWAIGLGVAAAAFLLAYPFLFKTPFSHHLMILILLYALMAQSWNVVAGLSGQISLGHAIFFGIGAYSSTVLFIKFGITPWIGLLVGMAISALAAIAIGVPTLRLRGHYFAIATLLIGLVESLGGLLLDPSYKTVIVFALYLAVVIVRPHGLFGRF